jgi:hypothetical protein
MSVVRNFEPVLLALIVFFAGIGLCAAMLPLHTLTKVIGMLLDAQLLSMILSAATPYIDQPQGLVSVLEVLATSSSLSSSSLNLPSPPPSSSSSSSPSPSPPPSPSPSPSQVLGMVLGIFNNELSIFKPGCGFPELSFTMEVD